MMSSKGQSRLMGREVGWCVLALLACAATTSRADLTQLTNPSHYEENPTATHSSGPEGLEIIKARGFIGELYIVPSRRDGAPLSIYHIINPLADPRTLNKYPVLEHHGVIGDISQMLGHSEQARPRRPVIGDITVDPSDTCLAFFLANNNFDVWLMDARGTNLNNYKASYDYVFTEGQKFWNFTLDDEIQSDLPTGIDFVLSQTHEQKLHYIAFSQSTLMMFGLLSWAPAYADKLVSYVALAPVAYVENIVGLTPALFASVAALPDNINGNFVPQIFVDTVAASLKMACQNEMMTHTLCAYVLSSIGGYGPTQLSHGFFSATFKGTAIKKVKHFMQGYAHRRFAMYDHGAIGNMAAYGQPVPPAYNLNNIRFPFIILFRGDRDTLSNPTDQARLLREMGTKPFLDFHFSNYQHLDFLLSKTVIRDVNVPAIQAMFHLLRRHASQLNRGIILRDPRSVYLPRLRKPSMLAVPDGNRRVAIRSDMVHNMINGIVETVEHHVKPSADGTGGDIPIPAQLVETPLNVLRGIGHQMDAMGSQMSRVADLFQLGSTPA